MARLGTAMTALNHARAAVLTAQDAVVEGATALDDVDAAAAAGERAATRSARAQVATTSRATTQALAALPALIAVYRDALMDLADTARQVAALDSVQQGLLSAVRTTGTAEAVAAEGLRTTGNGAWASYRRLDAASRTWLERSTAGWYRDRREGADAYAVLVADLRAPLDRARAALHRADAARRAAATRVKTALREADAALAPLRSPG